MVSRPSVALAKNEIYFQSVKVPFYELVQSDLRYRSFFAVTPLLQDNFFGSALVENTSSFSKRAQDFEFTRAGLGLGFQKIFHPNFGAVIEKRYYWDLSESARNSHQTRFGVFGAFQGQLSEKLSYKSYGEIFHIPELDRNSLTFDAFYRVLALDMLPSAAFIQPYLEVSAKDNSDQEAFGASLREFKTGLSATQNLSSLFYEFLIFKNWLTIKEMSPQELRAQLVLMRSF